MTGTYRANAGNPAAVNKLGEIRRSLERDGIKYSIAQADGIIVMHAWGKPKSPKRKPARPKLAPPAPTLEQCERRLKEALATFNTNRYHVQQSLRRQWRENGYEFRDWKNRGRDRARQRIIGHAVARIIARHKGDRDPHRFTKEDYADLDTALGRDVRRASHVPSHYDSFLHYVVSVEARGTWVKKPRHGVTPEPEFPALRESIVERYQALFADVEHWREMVRLAEDISTKKARRASNSLATGL